LWLDGERGQLDDFAGWMRELGANAWLFFCMWTVTGFDPRRYGARYYDEFPRFMEWQEGNGFRPYPTAFCDQIPNDPKRSTIYMSDAEQDAHFNNLRQHVVGRVLRYMNEAYQNGVSLCRRLPRIDGALCVRGQYSDDDTIESVGTVLDFSEKSFARKFQWARTAKDLEEIADATKKPGVGGEPPLGIFEQTIPWSRSDDPRGFADWHGTAELLGAGSFIHGDGSTVQACLRPGPRAQACANAISAMWSAGLPSDGLSAGRYTRGGLGDCPLRHSDRYDDGDRELDPSGALRTFAVIQGNRATAIVIEAGPGWRAEADHGWTITRQYGPHGQLVDLTR
jgi:hypothetical protein